MVRILVAASLVALLQAEVRPARTAGGIAFDVQGSGPPVVLISGSNLDRRMWDADADWLRARFTVVRYDLRAHGQSDTPAAPFSNVEDLLGVLDHLQIRTAAVLGLSAGSTIALDAALQAPERIDRMILVAPAISGYVAKERPAFFADLIAALQARDYEKADEVMLASPLFQVPDDVRPLIRRLVTENNRLWTVPRSLMKPPARQAAAHLEEVRSPTLVLVGDRDLPPQREQADVLARRVRGARLVVVPGGGHMLNLTSPAAFRTAVADFLAPAGR